MGSARLWCVRALTVRPSRFVSNLIVVAKAGEEEEEWGDKAKERRKEPGDRKGHGVVVVVVFIHTLLHSTAGPRPGYFPKMIHALQTGRHRFLDFISSSFSFSVVVVEDL